MNLGSLPTILLWLLPLIATVVHSQFLLNNDLRFPASWNGAEFVDVECRTQGDIPTYLDGYYLSQVSAAYGDSDNPAGQKLTHMIDAIGGMAAFTIVQRKVFFTGAFYPSQPYRIWQYYDRDFRRSPGVSWSSWSDFNRTAAEQWQQVELPVDSVPWHPNRNFWLVGNTILAVGHAPLWVGLQFQVSNLTEFSSIQFTADELGDEYKLGQGNLHPVLMASNSIEDLPNGQVWSVCGAVDTASSKSYMIVFTIDSAGRRTIKAKYLLGQWDTASECTSDDQYVGNKRNLVSYVYQLGVAGHFLVIPFSSLAVNPCKFKSMPSVQVRPGIDKGGVWGMDFYDDLPIRFLIFDMKKNEFLTRFPLETDHPGFVTHVINAYQKTIGLIYVDAIEYDNAFDFLYQLYTNQLESSTAFGGRVVRYGLGVAIKRAQDSVHSMPLLTNSTARLDFPAVSPLYHGTSYKFFYIVDGVFKTASKVLKINADTRQIIGIYEVGRNVVVSANPVFIADPSGYREDDGVLMIRALDMTANVGLLLIVSARDMSLVSRTQAPTSIPLGLYNTHYSMAQLGINAPAIPKLSELPPNILPEQMRSTEIPRSIFTSVPSLPEWFNRVLSSQTPPRFTTRTTPVPPTLPTKTTTQFPTPNPFQRNKFTTGAFTADWNVPTLAPWPWLPTTIRANYFPSGQRTSSTSSPESTANTTSMPVTTRTTMRSWMFPVEWLPTTTGSTDTTTNAQLEEFYEKSSHILCSMFRIDCNLFRVNNND